MITLCYEKYSLSLQQNLTREVLKWLVMNDALTGYYARSAAARPAQSYTKIQFLRTSLYSVLSVSVKSSFTHDNCIFQHDRASRIDAEPITHITCYRLCFLLLIIKNRFDCGLDDVHRLLVTAVKHSGNIFNFRIHGFFFGIEDKIRIYVQDAYESQ